MCLEEYPWRSQANLLLASCHLNQALGRLRLECGDGKAAAAKDAKDAKEEQEGQKLLRNALRLESTGIIIDGVIPQYPQALAGAVKKVRDFEEGLASLFFIYFSRQC